MPRADWVVVGIAEDWPDLAGRFPVDQDAAGRGVHASLSRRFALPVRPAARSTRSPRLTDDPPWGISGGRSGRAVTVGKCGAQTVDVHLRTGGSATGLGLAAVLGRKHPVSGKPAFDCPPAILDGGGWSLLSCGIAVG